ncbi:hypothetical protein GLOTRDRAFT_34130 [Gloeophyllum trabeum ATCC 11539]|uniref:20S-pre-rRNA D-site endonuclease NOB1 n=1 Tax=Gloeophyllum trabeum (strain ATCC 11539 / FP-39264 / Madison 617) TaxID=670483 RepID=S7S098_GLOTA|nr:uncharacterized protein GLOTRDRAFT_34130 [Gloeophyllum trabeum ATCC 11539]EPQ59129.1 hypothetical protein GLOTRDRAFT_34130 [Gloeophyllum trabeum ATCC 11539]
MAASDRKPSCKHLVLDAGPLLSLSPLRGLAETYYTVPQVLDELKDPRAREHFEKLGLSAGINIRVQPPDAASLAQVVQGAKKTGDYSVLSHADLCVLALTYALHSQNKPESSKDKAEPVSATSAAIHPECLTLPNPSNEVEEVTEKVAELNVDDHPADPAAKEEDEAEHDEGEAEVPSEPEDGDEEEREPLDVELQPISNEVDASTDSPETSEPPASQSKPHADSAPLYSEPSDEDDGEGEWITPDNVALHKSRHLDLLPSASSDSKKQETIEVGCMTADFAMQNVLLQMGLNLVSVDGKKIDKVKTWVLRCHACFEICKDSTRKFCPSCGNATLLRASVSIASPTASASAPAMQVHLKKNFQWKVRGTKYSIPAPKPGSAKTGTGEGLILREDQIEYQRAKKKADAKRERDERKMLSNAAKTGGDGIVVGSWMDPDWVPEIISVGAGGKGRSARGGDMPTIGYGRKNPNEKRRKRK